jgi:hypothetical protein
MPCSTFSGSRVAALTWINPQHPPERFAAIDTAPQLAIEHCPARIRGAGSSRIGRCRHVRLSSLSWDNPDLRIWGTRYATEELNFCTGCVNWFTLAHPHPAHSEAGGPSYVQHP